jgi:hypothetical protein
LQSQLHWIRDSSGAVPLDFIGRFEKLQEDFNYVCQRIGLPETKLANWLGRAADRRTYTELYDAETRAIVADRYADEIQMFGYTYGE